MPDGPGIWEPLSVEGVADLLQDMPTPWWIAGGWALDLHLGRHTRAHDDIDVLVPRRDLAGFHHRLRTWDLHAADPLGVLRPWHLGDTLPRTVHDIWCRPEPGSPWALQLMVDDSADDEWVYRRDPCIRRPVCQLAGPASNGTRLVLAPRSSCCTRATRCFRRTTPTSATSSARSSATDGTG